MFRYTEPQAQPTLINEFGDRGTRIRHRRAAPGLSQSGSLAGPLLLLLLGCVQTHGMVSLLLLLLLAMPRGRGGTDHPDPPHLAAIRVAHSSRDLTSHALDHHHGAGKKQVLVIVFCPNPAHRAGSHVSLTRPQQGTKRPTKGQKKKKKQTPPVQPLLPELPAPQGSAPLPARTSQNQNHNQNQTRAGRRGFRPSFSPRVQRQGGRQSRILACFPMSRLVGETGLGKDHPCA